MTVELEERDLRRLTDALEKVGRWADKGSGSNNNNFNVNFGGLGLGIALSLVAILIVICLMQNRTITRMESDLSEIKAKTEGDLKEMNRKLDRAEDYVNQIYRSQFKQKTK